MASRRMMSLLVVGLLFAANLYASEAQIGVCYGTMGTNLPPPQEVVALLEANKITKVRLLEPNKDVLTALKGKNIEVMLGIPNNQLTPNSAMDPTFAEKWVEANVSAYLPDVKIKYIVLGTEMSRNNQNFLFSNFFIQRISNFHDALQKKGFTDIKVTTSMDQSIIKVNEPNPVPSTLEMRPEAFDLMLNDTLSYLKRIGSPLLVNMWPYYEIVKFSKQIKPEAALFTAPGNIVTDGKLGYQNTFDIFLDSFYTIIEKHGYPDIEIIVAETGWPSAGGLAANVENEKTYITNLIQHVKKGTPKRPNKPIQAYVNLLDENMRGPLLMEQSFGVFTSDGKLKFPVTFNPAA